jgi:hypothetical protein
MAAALTTTPPIFCAIVDRRNEFTISPKPDRRNNMDTITVIDGTKIYFKDWGTGHPHAIDQVLREEHQA